MRRWAFISAGIAVLALVAGQLVVPGLAEREVEDRLTEGGGSAEVRIKSLPALRLLWDDGERLEVEARDLDLELDEDVGVFDRLDGFGRVEVSIADFRAGPFELVSLTLSRSGVAPYALVATGTTSPAELADYGASNLGLPGGPLAGLALETLLDDTDVTIPIELDMELRSEDGEISSEGDATVAGLPAGPVAEVITTAIVSQL